MFLYKPFPEQITVTGAKLSVKDKVKIIKLKQEIAEKVFSFFSVDNITSVKYTYLDQHLQSLYDLKENMDIALQHQIEIENEKKKKKKQIIETIIVKRKESFIFIEHENMIFTIEIQTFENEEEFDVYERENGYIFLNSQRLISVKDKNEENSPRIMSFPLGIIFKLTLLNNIITIQLNPYYYIGEHDTLTIKLKTNETSNLFYTLNHYRFNKKFGYEYGLHFKKQSESKYDFQYVPSISYNPSNTQLFSKSDLNEKYELCPTYASELYFPKSLTTEEIQGCAKHRSKNRLPIVTYYHHQTNSCVYRCSQPLVGSYGTLLQFIWDYQSSEDQKFIQSIRTDGKTEDSQMAIFDCRDQMASYGNRLAGKGGTENAQTYPKCEIVFLDIPNIHVVRDAFHNYRNAFVEFQSKQSKTLEIVLEKGKQWYDLTRLIKEKSIDVYKYFSEGKNILIHCSDGWDRTAQLSSLVKVYINGKYRTIVGFMELIQHDWISAGHKFQDRLHYANDESSPIFHQFIEIIFSLLMDNPYCFEFNDDFLIELLDEACCPTTVTFTRNNNRERDQMKYTNYESFFTRIVNNIQNYVNRCFDPVQELDFSDLSMNHIWTKFYMRDTKVNSLY